jgi:hypothetical protein
VALTLNLGKEVCYLEHKDHKTYLEYDNGEKHEVTNLQNLKKQLKTHPGTIAATSSTKDLPHDYYQCVNVFARTSPA